MRETNYSNQIAAANSTYSSGLAAGGLKSISQPDTFRGVLERMEALTKRAHSVAAHTRDVRSRVCGSFPVGPDGQLSAPTAVPNGLIEEFQATLSELEAAIGSADADLEHVWAKLS